MANKDKMIGMLTQAPKKFGNFLAKNGERIFFRVGVVILSGYVAATVVSSWAVGQFNFSKKKSANVIVSGGGGDATNSRFNYVKLRRGILGNNIFHPEREVPDETVEEVKEDESSSADFNIEAPCSPSRLKHTLLGTIALGPNSSIAILKEPGIQQADSYKIGDELIGQEGVNLVAVERKKIILNNNGRKECLKIKEKEIENLAGFDESEFDAPKPKTNEDEEVAEVNSKSGVVTLEGSWVIEQLGEGFSEIISAARLVPNVVEDSKINGFKIYKIIKDKIFGKIGFQEKDVITRVNDVSLTQPEQGFAVYEALEEEREITFNVLRKGTNPVTIRVQIK